MFGRKRRKSSLYDDGEERGNVERIKLNVNVGDEREGNNGNNVGDTDTESTTNASFRRHDDDVPNVALVASEIFDDANERISDTALYRRLNDALAAEIVRVIHNQSLTDDKERKLLDREITPEQKALIVALFRQVYRSDEFDRFRDSTILADSANDTDANNNVDRNDAKKSIAKKEVTNAEMLLDTLTDTCTRLRVTVSPVLSFQRDDKRAIHSICRTGWLIDDALCRIGDTNEEVRLPSAVDRSESYDTTKNSSNDKIKTPTLAALISETCVREVRLRTLRRRLERASSSKGAKEDVDVESDSNGNDNGNIEFPTLRTVLFCEYDPFACLSLKKLASMRELCRSRFERDLAKHIADATRIEREHIQRLRDERERLRALNAAIEFEREATRDALDRESQLSDRNAALTLMLANLETDLSNQELFVLQQAHDEIRSKMNDHATIRILRESVDLAEKRLNETIDMLKNRAEPVCRMLKKLLDETEWSTLEKNNECDAQLALRYYDRLLRAAAQCESSGALVLTTENLDEVEMIALQCEPLRKLRSSQRLTSVRSDLLVEQERQKLLDHLAPHHIKHVREYALCMYNYLGWLKCFDRMNESNFRIACTDDEAIRVYRSTHFSVITNLDRERVSKTQTSFALQNFANSKKFIIDIAKIALGDGENDGASWRSDQRRQQDARRATVVHMLVTFCMNCPLPKNDVLLDVLNSNNGNWASASENRRTRQRAEADVKLLTQRLFGWPVSLPEPEKRGIAFAILAATCPIDVSRET